MKVEFTVVPTEESHFAAYRAIHRWNPWITVGLLTTLLMSLFLCLAGLAGGWLGGVIVVVGLVVSIVASVRAAWKGESERARKAFQESDRAALPQRYVVDRNGVKLSRDCGSGEWSWKALAWIGRSDERVVAQASGDTVFHWPKADLSAADWNALKQILDERDEEGILEGGAAPKPVVDDLRWRISVEDTLIVARRWYRKVTRAGDRQVIQGQIMMFVFGSALVGVAWIGLFAWIPAVIPAFLPGLLFLGLGAMQTVLGWVMPMVWRYHIRRRPELYLVDLAVSAGPWGIQTQSVYACGRTDWRWVHEVERVPGYVQVNLVPGAIIAVPERACGGVDGADALCARWAAWHAAAKAPAGEAPPARGVPVEVPRDENPFGAPRED